MFSISGLRCSVGQNSIINPLTSHITNCYIVSDMARQRSEGLRLANKAEYEKEFKIQVIADAARAYNERNDKGGTMAKETIAEKKARLAAKTPAKEIKSASEVLHGERDETKRIDEVLDVEVVIYSYELVDGEFGTYVIMNLELADGSAGLYRCGGGKVKEQLAALEEADAFPCRATFEMKGRMYQIA